MKLFWDRDHNLIIFIESLFEIMLFGDPAIKLQFSPLLQNLTFLSKIILNYRDGLGGEDIALFY